MFGLASGDGGGGSLANHSMSNAAADNTITMDFNESNAAISHNSLSMYDINPEEIYDTNAFAQLKAAFIYHLKKNSQKCSEILRQLKTTLYGGGGDDDDDDDGDDSAANIDLDAIIVAIARDLADDIPAADPRWEAHMNRSSLGGSTSMQIIQQLKDKNIAMKLFVDFLRTTELWQRLATVNDRSGGGVGGGGGVVRRPTIQVLADVHEQIVAAISLKRIHQK